MDSESGVELQEEEPSPQGTGIDEDGFESLQHNRHSLWLGRCRSKPQWRLLSCVGLLRDDPPNLLGIARISHVYFTTVGLEEVASRRTLAQIMGGVMEASTTSTTSVASAVSAQSQAASGAAQDQGTSFYIGDSAKPDVDTYLQSDADSKPKARDGDAVIRC